MQYLEIEDLKNVDPFDLANVIVFRYRGETVCTYGGGLHSEFRCDNPYVKDELRTKYLLFYLDNKDLFRHGAMSGAEPNSNPSPHEMMLRFINDRLVSADVIEVIPPRFAFRPAKPGEIELE